MKSARTVLATAGLVVALATGCGPANQEELATGANAWLVSDQAHGDGQAGFFFLPPTLLQKPPLFTGTFDPTLRAVARVCEGTGTCDATSALAVFSADAGTGGGELAKLRALPKLGAYVAVWDTRKCARGPCSLVAGKSYRLHVYLVLPTAEMELGYADIQVEDLRFPSKLDPSNFSPLVKGIPYVIAFRIERCGPVLCASSGGTARLPNGPTVQIPPGALTGDTAIIIQQSRTQPPSGALTPVYSFGPDGLTFAYPVTVSFPIPPGTASASIYWTLPGDTTRYARLPTTIAGTEASAQVTHFSDGYLSATCGQDVLESGNQCCDNFTQGASCCGPPGQTTAVVPGNQCCLDFTQGESCCGPTALVSPNRCCPDKTQAPYCCHGTGLPPGVVECLEGIWVGTTNFSGIVNSTTYSGSALSTMTVAQIGTYLSGTIVNSNGTTAFFTGNLGLLNPNGTTPFYLQVNAPVTPASGCTLNGTETGFVMIGTMSFSYGLTWGGACSGADTGSGFRRLISN